MPESEVKRLPHFDTIDELVTFFENNDLGDYLEAMPEAEFEIQLQPSRHVFVLDADLAEKLTEVARSRHVASEELINDWLRETLREEV